MLIQANLPLGYILADIQYSPVPERHIFLSHRAKGICAKKFICIFSGENSVLFHHLLPLKH